MLKSGVFCTPGNSPGLALVVQNRGGDTLNKFLPPRPNYNRAVIDMHLIARNWAPIHTWSSVFSLFLQLHCIVC